jgi:hypothetical protein
MVHRSPIERPSSLSLSRPTSASINRLNVATSACPGFRGVDTSDGLPPNPLLTATSLESASGQRRRSCTCARASASPQQAANPPYRVSLKVQVECAQRCHAMSAPTMGSMTASCSGKPFSDCQKNDRDMGRSLNPAEGCSARTTINGSVGCSSRRRGEGHFHFAGAPHRAVRTPGRARRPGSPRKPRPRNGARPGN